MGVFDEANQSANEFRNTTAEAFSYLQDAFQSLAESIQQGFDDVSDAIDNTASTVDEKIKKSLERDVVNAVKKFNSSLSEGIKLNAKLISGSLDRNDILKARQNLQSKQLELQALLLRAKNNEVNISEENKKKLQEQIKFQEKEIKIVEELNKKKQDDLGLIGQGLQGIDGLLRKIGAKGLADSLGIQDAIDSNTKFTRDLEGNTLSAAVDFGGVFKSIKGNLKGAINPLDLVIAGLVKLGKAAQKADENVANLRRSFQVSASEAIKLNDGFAATAIRSGEITANVESLTQANQAVNDELGIQVRFQDDLLVGVNALIKRNKLSAEAASAVAKQTLATGENFDDVLTAAFNVSAELQNQSGITLNSNKLLEESTKISGQLRANLSRSPEGLVKAVAQAKLLGIELDNLNSLAGSLLDFESSISAELEAEVLTGKQLNFEQARLLALQGKNDEAAAAVVKQMGSLAEFQQMNVIQQNAIAKAAGLTVDQLATSLEKQAAINSQKQEGLDIDGETEKANASALSVQEQLASAVEKLNSILQMTGIIIGGIIGAAVGFLYGGPIGALIGMIVGGGAIGGIQAVSDGIAPSSNGPFTITDSFGATAITAKGDGIAVSPNISQGSGDGITKAQANEMITLLRKVADKDFSVTMDGRRLNTAMQTSGVA